MSEINFIWDHLNKLMPLGEQRWEKLKPLLKKKQISKNEHYVNIGDKVEKIAFIQKGLVRFYVITGDGLEFNQSFKKENEVVAAYYPLLTNKPSPMGIESLEDTVLYEIDYKAFESFYEQDPFWSLISRKFMETNFIIKSERELELLTLDGKTRYKKYQKEHPDLLSRIPQYHLALHFGMNPSSFNRMIKKSST